MRKILLSIILALSVCSFVMAATTEWKNSDTAFLDGTVVLINDADNEITDHIVDPLDRLLNRYRRDSQLTYNSTSTIDIADGEVACHNSGGTITKLRQNTSSVTLNITTNGDWDTGTSNESSNTTYYVYADCDAAATTFVGKISEDSATPSGVTSFLLLGSFVNNASSNITLVKNDDERLVIATGTVSNGGTISLPSGWSQDECDWTVGGPATNIATDCNGDGVNITISVSTSRVATCSNSANSTCTLGSTTCSANYLIACYR